MMVIIFLVPLSMLRSAPRPFAHQKKDEKGEGLQERKV